MDTINLPSLRNRMATLEAELLLTAQHVAVAEIYARLGTLKDAAMQTSEIAAGGPVLAPSVKNHSPQGASRGHKHPNSIAALQMANASRSKKNSPAKGQSNSVAAQTPN